MMNGKRVVIVGAGIAGLSAGLRLAEAGIRVTVVEKEGTVGGLARSFTYGDYVFDVGPHRFHTDDPEVLAFIKEALDGDFVLMPRSSGVWLFGRYHDWPLSIASLFKLPPRIILRVSRDLVARRRVPGPSFRDYIVERYGRTLYECFFREYTRKFLKRDPGEIHSDWARTGIDRAIIDKRLQMNTLFEVASRALIPRRVKTEFVYPGTGGIDAFSRALARRIEARGGEVRRGAPVEHIEIAEGRIRSVTTAGGATVPADLVVWTAPLDFLCRLAGLERPRLSYLSAVLYNVMVRGTLRLRYQWCYYGQEDLLFNRWSIPRHFRESTCPPGGTGIGVEVTCMRGDATWNDPERLAGRVASEMRAVGALGPDNAIEGIRIERIENVYPVYGLDYLGELEETERRLADLRNLVLLGRTGTFWYNNMDHSIQAGLECARDIVAHGGDGLRHVYARQDYATRL
ncbi:MAG: FAD-dependent oxidoreductase [Planctomycetia bacterium]|nr:FAD-dependent oxidoreductase [Planctomycetia bacterium]NLW94113.1 FAD-dependent oxidoreductase [Chlamydiota bacterium]HOE27047.1 FAD-dependent oxidoreductase [bacterium]HQM51988.1 FAD-dependent oxidoreductase [bacterium]